MVKAIFVNIPVRDLNASIKFWESLGFSVNPQFTNESAACLVLSEAVFIMLLIPDFFKTFTKKEIADSAKTTEVINAIGVESREAVDTFVTTALASGAKETRPADDYGWMYSRSFEDLDGHLWEVLYGDATQAPETPGTAA